MLIIFDINSKTKKNQPHSSCFVPLLHSFVFKFRYESFYSRPKSYNHHSCSLSESDLLLPVGVSGILVDFIRVGALSMVMYEFITLHSYG